MQNLEIVGIINAYMAQKEKGEGLKLPAAVAWKRRLNLDKLFKAKAVIDEAMKEIGQKYADDDHSVQDGDGRKVKPEFIADYAKEQAELLAQDTPVEITKVSIDDIGDVVLSDAEMDTLAFMLKEVD